MPMKYINTKTGIVQEFKCRVSGGDWQEVKASALPVPAASDKKTVRQPKKKDERK